MRLRLPLLLLASIAAVVPVVAAAQPWVPVSCEERAAELTALRERVGLPGDFRAAWQRYALEIRKAEPGAANYVPHPFPRSQREVFENFRYAFLNRLVRDVDAAQPRYRRALEAVQENQPRFLVARVENWLPGRCREDHHAPFYHLVRLFDRQGVEVARAALHENGLFAMFASLEGEQPPLDELDSIAARVEERFGVKVEPSRTQYVTASGGVATCRPVTPCIAFESGGSVYLVDSDFFLFSIEPSAPQLRVADEARRPVTPRTLSLNAGRENRPWITVGYGFREGRRVAVGPRGRSPE